MSATGPAIRAVCRILNQNSCGSGSICGHWKGGSLILTNAHVAGTKIGRQVRVEVESLGNRKLTGTVIRAAYSNSTSADWALLHVEGFQEVKPVPLSKNLPAQGASMYTKGFPRCQPHAGTDIKQVMVLANGVLLWLPDAIGGQSGSGVYGDDDHRQYALLTWSMTRNGRSYGAGQLCNEIYKQNRSATVRGYPRMDGLTELPGLYDFDGIARGDSDPHVEEGFHSIPMERGIQDFPIWADDSQPDHGDPAPGDAEAIRKAALATLRKIAEEASDGIKALESKVVEPVDPADDGKIADTFGL